MTTAPLRKSLHLGAAPVEVWETFTREIDRWWPLETHSRLNGDAVTCRFEAKPGGRIFEVSSAGDECAWGNVDVAERPSRLVCGWQPNPDQPAPTQIEVLFTPAGEGTQLVLVHRGWERLGAAAEAARADYDTGWDQILERFRDCLSE